MKKDSRQRLFEVMGRLDKTFKPKLNETTLSYGTDYDNPNDDYQADNDIKQKAEDLYDRGLTMFNSGDIDGAEKLRQEALKISSSLGWSENELPPFSESPENPMDEKYNKWSQSQDAWADIESGGQPNKGKELAKKVSQEKRGDRPSREMGSGSGDSHVPEYYYSYDSDDPISNVNGLTQGEIDAKNQAWRDNMERNVRGSYDNMYESRKKSGKQRLFEVMQRVDKTFKPKLNENEGYYDVISHNHSNGKTTYEEKGLTYEKAEQLKNDILAMSKDAGWDIDVNIEPSRMTPHDATKEFNRKEQIRLKGNMRESIGDNTWNVEKEYELPENQIRFTIEGSVHSAEGDPSMGNTEMGDWDIEWYDLKEGSYDEEYIDIIKEWMAGNAQTIKDDLEQAAIDKSGDYGDYLQGQEDEYNSLNRAPMKEDNYGRRRNPYDDNDEDDPDAGHTVNGKLLSPEEYRRWKEEEGEYDDTDRDRYRRRY